MCHGNIDTNYYLVCLVNYLMNICAKNKIQKCVAGLKEMWETAVLMIY